jgi:hypothetical protein
LAWLVGGAVLGGLEGVWGVCGYVCMFGAKGGWGERRMGGWYGNSGNNNDLEFFFSSFLQWAGLGMLGF